MNTSTPPIQKLIEAINLVEDWESFAVIYPPLSKLFRAKEIFPLIENQEFFILTTFLQGDFREETNYILGNLDRLSQKNLDAAFSVLKRLDNFLSSSKSQDHASIKLFKHLLQEDVNNLPSRKRFVLNFEFLSEKIKEELKEYLESFSYNPIKLPNLVKNFPAEWLRKYVLDLIDSSLFCDDLISLFSSYSFLSYLTLEDWSEFARKLELKQFGKLVESLSRSEYFWNLSSDGSELMNYAIGAGSVFAWDEKEDFSFVQKLDPEKHYVQEEIYKNKLFPLLTHKSSIIRDWARRSLDPKAWFLNLIEHHKNKIQEIEEKLNEI